MTAICPAGPPKESAATRSPDPDRLAEGDGMRAGAAGRGLPVRYGPRPCQAPGSLGSASCGSRPWRRGTSGRRRRRGPCRPRVAPGRRHTCARGRARRRAGRPPRARGRAAPCRRRARWSQADASGAVARPNSSTMTSKVQSSPRWLQNTSSPSMSKGVAPKRSATPTTSAAARTGTRRSDRRSGGSATGRRSGRSWGATRVTQTVSTLSVARRELRLRARAAGPRRPGGRPPSRTSARDAVVREARRRRLG